MASKMRWNIAEFENIRRSPQMVARLRRATAAIRSGCGTGYTESTIQGATRARSTVAAYTYDARVDNARNNTLLKNLDRGRL